MPFPFTPMNVPVTRIFIQARMSSARYPGKMLAPFRGQPLIQQVLTRVTTTMPGHPVIVLTSVEATDDPLTLYVDSLGVPVFRGPLDDVFGRFQQCLIQHPCAWVFRISGDSPLFDGSVAQTMLTYTNRRDIDLVTNVFPRTFPRGHSLEMINVATFMALESHELTPEEREHVTRVFYNHADAYRIVNVESGDPTLAGQNLTVDTLDDLRRLEAFSKTGAPT
jgi:spore coat polysaccharide biosynthesis protein SpsF